MKCARRWQRTAEALLVPALLALLPHRAAEAQLPSGGTGVRRELRGAVLDSVTGLPLSAIPVTVLPQRSIVSTDATGRFVLIGFLPDSVTILVRAVGYRPVSRVVNLTRGSVVDTVRLAKAVVQLEQVTVRQDSVAVFLSTAQVSSTLAGAALREQRGQTLGETLKDLPGVSIIQYGPSIAKPVVRGLHSQRIATISAGVSLEGQQWGGEHAPEVDAFAASEIEVIRGAGTILYGAGALGGVVRVMPRRLPTSGTLGGSLEGNGFLNNRQSALSLMLEGAKLRLPLLGHAAWRLQASARRAGDGQTPTYFLPNTGFSEFDYSGALGITRGWGTSTLSLSHFGTKLGLYLGAHVSNLDDLERAMATPLTTSTFSSVIGRPNQTVGHDLLSFNTIVQLPRGGVLDLTYGFQYNLRREFDSRGFAAASPRPAFALELFTHSVDAKYRHPSRGRWTGTLGVSGMRQGNLSPGRSFLIPQYRLYSGGVFALEQYALSRLTLSIAARYDARWQHAYQYGAPVIVSPDAVNAYRGISAATTASLRVTHSWSLSSTVTRAWRPPNVNERFSQGVHHGTAQYEIGDTTLGPERSLDADVTLRHLGQRNRLELSTYVRRMDGFIFLLPREPIVTVRGTYPAYAYARTNARLRGIEVSGQSTATTWLQLDANATVVRGIDRNSATSLYDMPTDRATVSARVFVPGTTRMVSPYIELGGTLVRRQDHLPPATIYRLPTSGYQIAKVVIGASAVRLRNHQIEPSLTIRNVFDVAYRDYLSRYRLFVNEPGRDVVLRFTMLFGSSSPVR